MGSAHSNARVSPPPSSDEHEIFGLKIVQARPKVSHTKGVDAHPVRLYEAARHDDESIDKDNFTLISYV